MSYTLIAYKPSSEDYCMGCCMAHYYADFIHECDLSEADVIKRIAELKSCELGCNEVGYEKIILIEQPPVPADEDEEWKLIQTRESKQNAIFGEASALALTLVQERKEQEKRKEEERRLKEQQEREARDRKAYEELKAKFETK